MKKGNSNYTEPPQENASSEILAAHFYEAYCFFSRQLVHTIEVKKKA